MNAHIETPRAGTTFAVRRYSNPPRQPTRRDDACLLDMLLAAGDAVEFAGMRNRLVHTYFEVDLKRVWKTAQQDIPRLINLIEPLVPPETA